MLEYVCLTQQAAADRTNNSDTSYIKMQPYLFLYWSSSCAQWIVLQWETLWVSSQRYSKRYTVPDNDKLTKKKDESLQHSFCAFYYPVIWLMELESCEPISLHWRFSLECRLPVFVHLTTDTQTVFHKMHFISKCSAVYDTTLCFQSSQQLGHCWQVDITWRIVAVQQRWS